MFFLRTSRLKSRIHIQVLSFIQIGKCRTTKWLNNILIKSQIVAPWQTCFYACAAPRPPYSRPYHRSIRLFYNFLVTLCHNCHATTRLSKIFEHPTQKYFASEPEIKVSGDIHQKVRTDDWVHIYNIDVLSLPWWLVVSSYWCQGYQDIRNWRPWSGS